MLLRGGDGEQFPGDGHGGPAVQGQAEFTCACAFGGFLLSFLLVCTCQPPHLFATTRRRRSYVVLSCATALGRGGLTALH